MTSDFLNLINNNIKEFIMRKQRKKKDSDGVKLLRFCLKCLKAYVKYKEEQDRQYQIQKIIQQINEIAERHTYQTNIMIADIKSIYTNVVVV